MCSTNNAAMLQQIELETMWWDEHLGLAKQENAIKG